MNRLDFNECRTKNNPSKSQSFKTKSRWWGWGTWPYWFRGGVISLLIYSLYSILTFWSYKCPYDCLDFFILSSLGIVKIFHLDLFVKGITSTWSDGLLYSFVVYITWVLYFILGAIFGFFIHLLRKNRLFIIFPVIFLTWIFFGGFLPLNSVDISIDTVDSITYSSLFRENCTENFYEKIETLPVLQTIKIKNTGFTHYDGHMYDGYLICFFPYKGVGEFGKWNSSRLSHFYITKDKITRYGKRMEFHVDPNSEIEIFYSLPNDICATQDKGYSHLILVGEGHLLGSWDSSNVRDCEDLTQEQIDNAIWIEIKK